MAKAENLGTVARVIALLRTLAENNHRLTLSDIAGKLGLAPSTTHRLVSLLVNEGLIARDAATKTYYCAAEFVRIASLVKHTSSIADLAQPLLEHLVERFNETTLLCLYLEKQRRYTIVSVLHGTELLRYDVKENVPLEMPWGATARSILAYLPQEDVDAIVARADTAVTGEPPRPEVINEELAEIRARGYAITSGQRIAGSIGIGAPVFDMAGRVVGSVCLTIPRERFSPDRQEEYGAALMRQAALLSQSLGYSEAAESPRSSRS